MTDYNEEIFTIVQTNRNALESYFDEQNKDKIEKFQIDNNIYKYTFSILKFDIFQILVSNDLRKPEDLSELVIDYLYGEVHLSIDDVLDYNFIEDDHLFRKSVENLIGRENIFKQLISVNNVQILENYFKKNGFTYYVSNNNIHDDHNNILIFFIENDASLEYIEFILSHYHHPNNDKYIDHPSFGEFVLSIALGEKKFQIANLLLRRGLKIKTLNDIFKMLISNSSLNQQNFSYLLDIGFKVTSISYYDSEYDYLVKYINAYYFYDKACILKFLFYYKDGKKTSQDELLTIISNHSINNNLYRYAFKRKYYESVTQYLQCDKREFQEIFEHFSKELLEMVLDTQDDYLTREIDCHFSESLSKYISLNILSNDHFCNKENFTKFIQICFTYKTFDTKCVFLDHCLSSFKNISYRCDNNNNNDFIKIFLESFLNHPTFNFKFSRFNECILVLKGRGKKFIEYVFDLFYHHPTFDVNSIELDRFLKLIQEMDQSQTVKTKTSTLMNQKYIMNFINQIFSHPTFDFISAFENILKNKRSYLGETVQLFLDYLNDHRDLFHPSFLIENLFILAIKYDSFISAKLIFKYLFRIKKFENINFEDILLESIQYNRVLIFKLMISMISRNHKNLNLMEGICFEKLLLESNKKSCNIEIITIILEMLLEISVTQEYVYIYLPNLKAKDITYLSLLLNSIIKIGNYSLIKCLLENEEHPFNINSSDENGDCPLMVAFKNCMNNDNGLNIYRYLLYFSTGTNMKVDTKNEISIFVKFLQDKNYKMLRGYDFSQSFLEEEEEEEKSNPSNHSFISLIGQNNLEKNILLTLLEKDTKINNDTKIYEKYSLYGFTPLIFSYLIRKKEIFKMLLSYFNIMEFDLNGYHLLHYVVMKEDIETLKYLIHSASNHKKKLEFDELLYDISISIGNKEIFLILLEYSNKKKMLNSLLFMVLKNHQCDNFMKIEFLKELIQRGCSVNISDKNGKYALTYSIETKCLSIVKLLIENGADANVKNQNMENKNETPLMYSIRIRNIPIFEYMTKMFINNKNILEIQRSVIYRNNLDLLQILSSHHKLIHTKDYNNSPLALAIKVGNIDMVEFLINFYNSKKYSTFINCNLKRYCKRNDLETFNKIKNIILSKKKNNQK